MSTASITAELTDPSAQQLELLKVFGGWNESCLTAQSLATGSDLENEVSLFFSSYHTTTTTTTLSQQQLYEQSLAILMQSLEQAFTTPHLYARISALACVKGALQQQPKQQPELLLSIHLSLPVMKLLGNFVLQHCGPILIEDNNNNNDDDLDLDEHVRDSAIQTINSLLQTKTMANDDNHSHQRMEESIINRIHLSHEAIKLRCAVSEEEDIGPASSAEEEDTPIAPRGLASLSRLRRSLCFEVLQSTLNGLRPLLLDPTAKTLKISTPLLQWVEYSINCLHGESDPRCLIQLLKFLSDVQRVCVFVLEKTFPVDAMFDAASSYYPIQFNPPPQMAFAVTREELTTALWEILSFVEYDESRKGRGDTMFSLTLGLVLDQLMPLPEDGPATVEEQRDALVDLGRLLRTSKPADNDAVGDVAAISQGIIDTTALVQVAAALRTVHAKTAVSGAAGSPIAHNVSHLCRDLISQISLSCERQKKMPQYWALFVKDVTLDMVRSAPLSRSDVVYLACLTGCGGLKTLNYVLDQALPVFLRVSTGTVVSADMTHETASAMCDALYGIAALLASVQASLKRQPAGVVPNPHPLLSHGPKLINCLLPLWNQVCNIVKGESDVRQAGLAALRLAVVRAMETAMMVLPASIAAGQMEQLQSYLTALDEKMTTDNTADLTKNEQQFLVACARSLGIAIGEAMNDDHDDDAAASFTSDYFIFRSGTICPYLKDKIFPRLLQNFTTSRYGQIALAVACTRSKVVAKNILQEFSSIVVQSIKGGGVCTGEIIGEVARVLCHGARNASEAFQLSKFLFEVKSALQPDTQSINGELNFGVSSLQLPVPVEEAEKEQNELERIIMLLVPLQPLYEVCIVPSHLQSLVEATCKVIPPLDSNDMKSIAILLPFLSVALQSYEDVKELDQQTITDMISFLPEFILSNATPVLRNYGITCLHTLLIKGIAMDSPSCPCLAILEKTVMTSIVNLFREIEETSSKRQNRTDKLLKDVKGLGEAIAFTGSIGSAAIQRSRVSSKTADRVVRFLVDLACSGKAETITDHTSNAVLISVTDAAFFGALGYVKYAAITAFGAILSSGQHDALWKQRLCFIAWKEIQLAMKSNTLSIGLVGTSAYILCTCGWKSMSLSMSAALSDIVLRGLSLGTDIPGTLKKVLLAAVVKLISLKHDLIEKNLLTVITGVLRAYATADGGDCSTCCKIVALQALEGMPTLLASTESISDVKPAVISILEQAMVDKSSILRHAAVEVRNSWFLA
ncbi:hypothetical protein ACA910_021743 [Epithemia clementina (nom. ined.)]